MLEAAKKLLEFIINCIAIANQDDGQVGIDYQWHRVTNGQIDLWLKKLALASAKKTSASALAKNLN